MVLTTCLYGNEYPKISQSFILKITFVVQWHAQCKQQSSLLHFWIPGRFSSIWLLIVPVVYVAVNLCSALTGMVSWLRWLAVPLLTAFPGVAWSLVYVPGRLPSKATSVVSKWWGGMLRGKEVWKPKKCEHQLNIFCPLFMGHKDKQWTAHIYWFYHLAI